MKTASLGLFIILLTFRALGQTKTKSLPVTPAENESIFRPLAPSCRQPKGVKSVDALCDQTKKCCHDMGLNMDCSLIENVKHEDILMNKRVYVWNRFNDLKKFVVKDCCMDDKRCSDNFLNIRLWIDKGYPPDGTANFVAPNLVRVGDSELYSCATRGCYDRLLLHELGHGCEEAKLRVWQWSKYSELFKKTFGPETGKCIHDVFEARKGDMVPLGEVHPGAWEREAFADLVFMGHVDTLDSTARLCGGNEETFHSQPQTYLHCFKKYGTMVPSPHPYAYGIEARHEAEKDNGRLVSIEECREKTYYQKLKKTCQRIISAYRNLDIRDFDPKSFDSKKLEQKYQGITQFVHEFGLGLEYDVPLCIVPSRLESELQHAKDACNRESPTSKESPGKPQSSH